MADNLPAVHPGPRPNIKDVIRLADGLLIVLNHDHSVPLIAQVLQCIEETVIVALVQTNRRLIKNIENARQPRADLARQTNALTLTTT